MHLIGPAYLYNGQAVVILGLQREHIKSKMLFERETGRQVAGEGSLKPQA